MKPHINTLKNSIKEVIGNGIIKKSSVLITAGILASFSANAKVDVTPSVTISDASKTIKDHIKFPNLVMDFNKEEKVNVVFTVNETGNVNLVVVNTLNENLKNIIQTQFVKLKLSNLKANSAYSVVFNFKTI